MANADEKQSKWYQQAAAEFDSALVRLARVYEPDAERRRDLLQDIHVELWRSFVSYQSQCSLRTWVYRVAHNVGISRRIRKRKLHLVCLSEIDELPADGSVAEQADREQELARLYALIRRLESPDDQVMLMYLEDMDAESIGEVTGLSATAVANRIYRVKSILARRFNQRGRQHPVSQSVDKQVNSSDMSLCEKNELHAMTDINDQSGE